jgi:hypothetical protein
MYRNQPGKQVSGIAIRTAMWAAIVTGAISAGPALAARNWTKPLTDWQLYLDNGVVYVTAANMPANCSYSRAEIRTSAVQSGSPTYARDLYAFVLASRSAERPLRVAIDDAESTCLIYGAKND